MIRIKSHTKPKQFGILTEGDYVVRIESITGTYNKDHDKMPWFDKTPQLAFVFKCSKGQITLWVNLKGYMTEGDYENAHSAELDGIIFKAHPFSGIRFAVDLNNNRIENPDKTLTCMHILGRISHNCGIPAGQDVELHQLVGKELAIRIQKLNGSLKVTHTFKKV